MGAANKGHIEVVTMLNANTEAVDKVSRNVNMACTALSIIPIIIIVISYCQYHNFILSIISLYSYSIDYQDVFCYDVVVKLCVMVMQMHIDRTLW